MAEGGAAQKRVHFTCQRDTDEDKGTVDYLRDTAVQGGIEAPVPLHRRDRLGRIEIRRHGKQCDPEPVQAVSLGMAAARQIRHNVRAANLQWIEPAWRLILSGKGILALLWELFPTIPTCCRVPGAGADRRAGDSQAAFGREGANISAPGVETAGTYGEEGYVFQGYAELPQVNGRYALIVPG